MIQSNPSQSSTGFLPLAVVLGVPLAVAGVALQFSATAPKPVQATEMSIDEDQDNDGLTDGQEVVLRTSPISADTDGDGFSDLEEFARHSSPLSSDDVPGPHPVSVALSARGGGGMNRIFAAFYSADGDFSDHQISLGAAARGRMITFRPADVARTSDTDLVDVSGAGRVYIVDRRMSPRAIRRLRYISFYGAIGPVGATRLFEAAAVVDLQTVGGYTNLVRRDHAFADWYVDGTLTLSPSSAGGSAHVPIPARTGGGEDESTAGAACVQQTSPVGSSGAIVTREVVQASCEDGWDSFCSGGCSSSAGSTFDTVDPVALVGG